MDSKIFECRDSVRGVDMNMAPVSGVVWEDRGRKEGGGGRKQGRGRKWVAEESAQWEYWQRIGGR